MLGFLFGLDDGGNSFFRNACKLPPDYTAQLPRK
jgi:hypothetical protein